MGAFGSYRGGDQMKLAFLGDYYVDPALDAPPQIGPMLTGYLLDAELATVNLEGPVAPSDAVLSPKSGPNLRQHPEAIETLAAAGINVVCIANNHSWDYGKNGLDRTVQLAIDCGVKVAGLVSEGQAKTIYHEAGPIRVAILAFAEHEWCGPLQGDPCIALAYPIHMGRSIAEAAKEADAVFVIIHGNNEYHALPSPALKQLCEFSIEQGASAVIVHHAHVFSGTLIHNGCPIFFGLGNFQFAKPSTKQGFYEGLLAEFEVSRDSNGEVVVRHSHLPITSSMEDYSVEIAQGKKAEEILNEHSALSILLQSDEAVSHSYRDFVVEAEPMYLEMLNPFILGSKHMRFIGRRLVRWWLKRPERSMVLLNSYRCESHRNAMIATLESNLAKCPKK